MPKDWQENRGELYSRTIGNGLELARARRELFAAVVARLMRIEVIVRANVRLVDQDASGRKWLHFEATAGPDWSPETLARIFPFDGGSLGARVIREELPEFYCPHAKTAPHYELLFDDVESLFVVSVKVRGRVVALIAAESGDPEIHSGVLDVVREVARECEQTLEHFALIEDKWVMDVFKEIADARAVLDACEIAVERSQSLFGVASASIFLFDAASERLVLTSTTRKDRPDPDLSYGLGEGLTGWIGKHRKSLRLKDYAADSERRAIAEDLVWANASRFDPRSVGAKPMLLGVPLQQANKLIGVIRVANKHDQTFFTLEDEQFMERIADALAIKIEYLWLIERQRQQIDRGGKLVDFGAALAAASDFKELGAVLLNQLPELTGAAHLTVRNITPDSNLRLVVATCAAFPEHTPVGQYLVGEAAQKNEPMYFADDRDARWRHVWQSLPKDDALRRVQRAALLPLDAKRAVVGTISLFWDNPGDFREEEQQLLQDLAARTAVAMERCRLKSEVDQNLAFRDRIIAQIHAVGAGFLTTGDIRRLYQEILKGAAQIAGVTYGTIRSLSPDGDTLLGEAAYGISEDIILGTPLPADSLDAVQLALQDGHPRVIADTRESQQYAVLLQSHSSGEYGRMLKRTQAILIVPIRSKDRLLAVIFLDSEKALELKAPLITYLEILAGYAAVAIENARLHEERQRSLQLQEPQALMGQLLGGYLHSLRNPLQAIANQIGNLEHERFPREMLPGVAAALRLDLKRLQRIADDMTLLAQSHTFRSIEKIDLRALVGEVAAEFRPDNLKIDWLDGSSAETTVEVRGNEVQVKIALRMLISNAIDAVRDAPVRKICLMAIADREYGEITVADSGPGMDAEVIKKATEPFFTTKRDGSGLGLAIASGVASRHGGRIEIQSDPGKGATVKLLFPREEAQKESHVI